MVNKMLVKIEGQFSNNITHSINVNKFLFNLFILERKAYNEMTRKNMDFDGLDVFLKYQEKNAVAVPKIIKDLDSILNFFLEEIETFPKDKESIIQIKDLLELLKETTGDTLEYLNYDPDGNFKLIEKISVITNTINRCLGEQICQK